MKTLSKLFLMAAMLCLNFTLSSQEEATTYYLFDYMKVEPGMHKKYLDLEKAWKKIHQVRKEAGEIEDWTLMNIVLPSGTDVDYNYVTRIRLKGEKQLAAHLGDFEMPDNLESILTADELALVKETSKIRAQVGMDVFAKNEIIRGDGIDEAKIAVVNFFDYPEGKNRGDHFRVERDIWMPIHKARIEANQLEGWVMARKVAPGGSAYPYHDMTVDIYDNMEQMLMDSPQPYFEKVHPGKDMYKLFDETDANCDLIRREIRKEVDSL